MIKLHQMLITIGTTIGLSMPVLAQSSHHNFKETELGVSAGVQFTLPLGATRPDERDDYARIGLTLSFDQARQNNFSNFTERHHANLLELGFMEKGEPNIRLYDQDIYTPLFNPLYADEDEGQDKKSNSTGWYIVGGLAVVGIGSYVLVNNTQKIFASLSTQVI